MQRYPRPIECDPPTPEQVALYKATIGTHNEHHALSEEQEGMVISHCVSSAKKTEDIYEELKKFKWLLRRNMVIAPDGCQSYWCYPVGNLSPALKTKLLRLMKEYTKTPSGHYRLLEMKYLDRPAPLVDCDCCPQPAQQTNSPVTKNTSVEHTFPSWHTKGQTQQHDEKGSGKGKEKTSVPTDAITRKIASVVTMEAWKPDSANKMWSHTRKILIKLPKRRKQQDDDEVSGEDCYPGPAELFPPTDRQNKDILHEYLKRLKGATSINGDQFIEWKKFSKRKKPYSESDTETDESDTETDESDTETDENAIKVIRFAKRMRRY